MTYLGLLAALALLMWLALRGVNIVFASILCSLLVIITNDLPLAAGLSEYYAFGSLGAFTFAGKFFLLFVSGAIFGRIMGDSQAASSIAMALVRAWGAERALWITTLACALLTYGGVVVFVVIFAMYPLGLRLLKEANIPKRLFLGAIALGSGTFTLTALPGTPSIHNVIPSVGLGTDLYAGAWLGMLGGVLMLVMGMWYLEQQRNKAIVAGECFVPGPMDTVATSDDGTLQYPHWLLALVPLLVVLLTILAPRLLAPLLEGSNGYLAQGLQFAVAQPILWPSLALLFGSVVATVLFAAVRSKALILFGNGTQDAIMPLINTAAVIGFSGVVTHTQGFQQFTQMMAESSLPPLLSMFASISLVSGITGSASGGLQIFMQTMSTHYLSLGIPPEVLHRLVTMAAGGFDSLPHCGAVISMLTITGLTHREAYKDIAIITVLIPVIATLLTMLVYMLVS